MNIGKSFKRLAVAAVAAVASAAMLAPAANALPLVDPPNPNDFDDGTLNITYTQKTGEMGTPTGTQNDAASVDTSKAIVGATFQYYKLDTNKVETGAGVDDTAGHATAGLSQATFSSVLGALPANWDGNLKKIMRSWGTATAQDVDTAFANATASVPTNELGATAFTGLSEGYYLVWETAAADANGYADGHSRATPFIATLPYDHDGDPSTGAKKDLYVYPKSVMDEMNPDRPNEGHANKSGLTSDQLKSITGIDMSGVTNFKSDGPKQFLKPGDLVAYLLQVDASKFGKDAATPDYEVTGKTLSLTDELPVSGTNGTVKNLLQIHDATAKITNSALTGVNSTGNRWYFVDGLNQAGNQTVLKADANAANAQYTISDATTETNDHKFTVSLTDSGKELFNQDDENDLVTLRLVVVAEVTEEAVNATKFVNKVSGMVDTTPSIPDNTVETPVASVTAAKTDSSNHRIQGTEFNLHTALQTNGDVDKTKTLLESTATDTAGDLSIGNADQPGADTRVKMMATTDIVGDKQEGDYTNTAKAKATNGLVFDETYVDEKGNGRVVVANGGMVSFTNLLGIATTNTFDATTAKSISDFVDSPGAAGTRHQADFTFYLKETERTYPYQLPVGAAAVTPVTLRVTVEANGDVSVVQRTYNQTLSDTAKATTGDVTKDVVFASQAQQIKNYAPGQFELPLTGGTGTILLTLTGLALITFAVAYFMRRREHEEV